MLATSQCSSGPFLPFCSHIWDLMDQSQSQALPCGSLQTRRTAFILQAPSRDCLGDLQKQSAGLMKSEEPGFSILNLGIKRKSRCKQGAGVSTAVKAQKADCTAQHGLRQGKSARTQPQVTKKEEEKKVQILFPKLILILFPSSS